MRQRILTAALDWLGPRYPVVFIVLELQAAFIVTAGACLLLTAYVDFPSGEFLRFLIFAEAVVALTMLMATVRIGSYLRCVKSWLAGNKGPAQTIEAWQAAISMPANFLRKAKIVPFISIALPIVIYSYFAFNLTIIEAAILYAATCATIAYAFILHYFALELGMRPIVVRISQSMPGELPGGPSVLPLKWKLLMSLPMVSVITGLIVASLSADEQGGILGLGVDVLIVVAVAFTIALEMTILLTRSILVPVHELVRATQSVSKGDLDVRVPITSTDEIGTLARSFNEMVAGIGERERLREAFGSYVGTRVAERVMEKGEMIEGEEIDVSILFADIRDFTAIASNSSPREVVNLLNNFYECIVPVLHKHGGHANKFIGDGLLAVFGAPERHPDHADRALRAAQEILREISDRFGDELEVGLGINSGKVLAGSVGGGGRLEFSVIGDTVNVASRIEEFTRKTGDRLLVSAETYQRLNDSTILERREPVMLKGKDEPIELYAMPVAVAEGSARRT